MNQMFQHLCDMFLSVWSNVMQYKRAFDMVLSSEALAILLRYSVDTNEIANRVKSIDRVKALLFL